MPTNAWSDWQNGLEELLLGIMAALLGYMSGLFSASYRRLLGAALRLLGAAQWALSLFVPGSFQLAHTVANRVRLLLEHSAALGLEGPEDEGEEPLSLRRLAGLPPPVAVYLRGALADLPSGSPDFKVAHLKLAGHMRFTPPGSSSSSGGGGGSSGPASAWHRLQADCYLCPGSSGGSNSGSGTPGYVLSATVQMGPLSWVRGYSSFLQGAGASQWKLCSPFRARDLDMRGAGLLGGAPLAAFLAVAPCCPTALLPSAALKWRALNEQSAEATVRCGGGGGGGVEQASVTYHFDRAGRIIKAAITGPSAATSTAASAAALAGGNSALLASFAAASSAARGAGRLVDSAAAASASASGASAAAPTPGGSAGAPLVCYYRRHETRCGMAVPTELEACWGEQQLQQSFLHCDLADLAAWTSLDMAPLHQHQ